MLEEVIEVEPQTQRSHHARPTRRRRQIHTVLNWLEELKRPFRTISISILAFLCFVRV